MVKSQSECYCWSKTKSIYARLKACRVFYTALYVCVPRLFHILATVWAVVLLETFVWFSCTLRAGPGAPVEHRWHWTKHGAHIVWNKSIYSFVDHVRTWPHRLACSDEKSMRMPALRGRPHQHRWGPRQEEGSSSSSRRRSSTRNIRTVSLFPL